MATKVTTTSWSELRAQRPSPAASSAAADEARITAFRELVHRLRSDAGLTQAELADRMGTTQSAIARMEGGGTRPTLETLRSSRPLWERISLSEWVRTSRSTGRSRSSSAKATPWSAALVDAGPRRVRCRP